MIILKSLAFSVIICSNFILSQSYNPVNKIVIISEELQNIMDSILHDKDFHFKQNQDFIICQLLAGEKKIELNIYVVEKSFFQEYMLKKEESLIGYTEYKGFLALIWGNRISGLFATTNEIKNFEFLSLKKTKKKSKSKREIIIPPLVDPIIWNYEIIDNRIYFLGKGGN